MDVDVVIFDGAGTKAKSPYVGVKNSRVFIDNKPVSNNKVGLNFDSSCIKYSCEVNAGAIGFLNDRGALTSNLSCFKSKASIKPAVDTTIFVTAIQLCRPE